MNADASPGPRIDIRSVLEPGFFIHFSDCQQSTWMSMNCYSIVVMIILIQRKLSILAVDALLIIYLMHRDRKAKHHCVWMQPR